MSINFIFTLVLGNTYEPIQLIFAIDLIIIRVHFVKYISWVKPQILIKVNTQKLIKNAFISFLNHLNTKVWISGK